MSVTRSMADMPFRRERAVLAAIVEQAVLDSQAGDKRAQFWLNSDRGLFVELAELLNLNTRAVRDKARPRPIAEKAA